MNALSTYIRTIAGLIDELSSDGMASMQAAAGLIADSLIRGGTLHAFGTGHSHMFALEIFYRAGGLVRVNPILDEGLMLHGSASKSTDLERLPGYSSILLDHNPVHAGDVMIIASNSGRNSVPIEMALESKKRGLAVIALTSMRHTRSVESRHPSGRHLWEVADIVLDNRGCPGDASVEIAGIGRKVSPTSTVIGALMLNAIMAEAIQIMVEKGSDPEVFASSNIDEGDVINEEYVKKYRGVFRSL